MEHSETEPNLDDMIDASTGPSAAGAVTALDELADKLADDALDAAGELPGADELPQPAKRSHHRKGETGTGRPRGRPRKDAGDVSAIQPGVERTTKQQLADEVAQLRIENARLKALADGASVAQLAQSIELLTVVAFGVVAEARGPHWAATAEEAHAVGESAAVAAAPYAEQLQKSLPWVAPIIALGSMIGKRVMMDARIVREARERGELSP